MSSANASDYIQQLFSLTGKTAIVVGGTGVLGGAIADALGRAGAHVVVIGRNSERGLAQVARIEADGGSAEFFAADSTSREDIQQIADQLAARSRYADVLVNGAGINAATPFVEITDEEWDQIFAVNLSSVRIACQIFGKQLIDNDLPGSIINIASLSAMTPLSRVFTYSATKAAVLNLTQNLAREWATNNIRVNALSPGFFPAEQNRKVLTPDRVDSIMTHTPMKRFGSPEELAGAILFLASPNAGGFVTGANIVVDGGFTAMTI